MQLQVKAGIALAHVLFIDNLRVAEIRNCSAAVLLVGPHQQVALLTRLGERPAIHIPLLTPARGMRSNLLLHEPAYRVAKLLVLRLEDEAAHVGSSAVKARAVRGALAQPLRDSEARPVVCGHPVALGYKSRKSGRLDERQGAARPSWKSPPEDGADVAFLRLGKHAFLEATRGLERLNEQQALANLGHRRLTL